jgi:hypothetical protein
MNGGSPRLYTIEADANPEAPRKPIYSAMGSELEPIKLDMRMYLSSLGFVELD